MNKTKIAVIFTLAIVLLFTELTTGNKALAQPSDNDQIPSDLSLDLKHAQQNFSQDQQTIVNSEVKQAQEVTTTGQTTVVKPQDVVAKTAQTEPVKAASNPTQTTSEQVVTVPTTIQVDQNGSPAPTGASQDQNSTLQQNQSTQNNNDNSGNNNNASGTNGQNYHGSESAQPTNVVPGTAIQQPDDNAAPHDNSSNPDMPAPTSQNNSSVILSPTVPQITPTPTQPQGGNQTQPTQAAPTAAPTDSSGGNPQTQATVTPTATDASIPNPTTPPDASQPSSNTTTPNPTASPDSSVQGAETVRMNVLDRIVNAVMRFFNR